MDRMEAILELLKSGEVATLNEMIKATGLGYKGIFNIIIRLKKYDAEIVGTVGKGYKLINTKDYDKIYKRICGRTRRRNNKEVDKLKKVELTEDINYSNIKNIMILRGGMEMERKEAIKFIKRVVNCKNNIEEMEIRNLYDKWRKEVLTD